MFRISLEVHRRTILLTLRKMIGLNSPSNGKWTNQNFLVLLESTRILVEITRILIDIIILIKIRILIDFTKNIVLTKILIIS